MKKLILFLGLIFCASSAKAIDVWTSSNTVTNDGAYKMLCGKRAVFHGICTNFGVAAASTTIVASSFTFTAAGSIQSISTLAADQCKYYDTVFTNGMGYQKTNVASVSILYQCY